MDWSQPLLWFAPLVGFGAVLIGLAAALFPRQASKSFGVPTSGSGLPWVRATGTRDVFLGFTVLLLSWRGDRLALSLVCFCTAFIALGDFLLTYFQGTRKLSIVHLAGLVVAIAYGVWLFHGAAV